MGLVGWVVTSQVTNLSADVPAYSQNAQHKLQELEQALEARGGPRLSRALRDVERYVGLDGTVAHSDAEAAEARREPTSGWVSHVVAYFGAVAETAGQVGLAIILAIFMLLKKEDLRNRGEHSSAQRQYNPSDL